jgi:hypothetical protein
LSPATSGGEERAAAFAHGGDDFTVAVWEGFSGEAVEERFGVERVEVGGPAFHEEEDDAFCFRGEVGDCFWGARGFFGEKLGECERAEAEASGREGVATGDDGVWRGEAHD